MIDQKHRLDRSKGELCPDVLTHYAGQPWGELAKRVWEDYHNELGFEQIKSMSEEDYQRHDAHLRYMIHCNVDYWSKLPWLDAFNETRVTSNWGKDIRGLEMLFDVIDRRLVATLGTLHGRLTRDDADLILTATLAPSDAPPLYANARTLTPKHAHIFKQVMAARGWQYRRKGTSGKYHDFRRWREDALTSATLPKLTPDFDPQGHLRGFVPAEDQDRLDEIEANLRAKLTAPEAHMQRHLVGRLTAAHAWAMADPEAQLRGTPIAGHRIGAVLREFGFTEHPSRRSLYIAKDGRPLGEIGWVPLNVDHDTGDVSIRWKRLVIAGPPVCHPSRPGAWDW